MHCRRNVYESNSRRTASVWRNALYGSSIFLNIAVTAHAQCHLGGGDDAIDGSRIHESTQCRAVEGEGSSPTKAVVQLTPGRRPR
jgi:hypothetical protein